MASRTLSTCSQLVIGRPLSSQKCLVRFLGFSDSSSACAVGNLAHVLSVVNRFDPLDKPLSEEHELSLHLFSVVGLSC